MSYNICPKCGQPNGVVGMTVFQCRCARERAAQHLKREQEQEPALAAQPPQELVSLAAKWRADSDKCRARFADLTDEDDIEWRTELETHMNDMTMCADELEAALTRGAVGRAAEEPK